MKNKIKHTLFTNYYSQQRFEDAKNEVKQRRYDDGEIQNVNDYEPSDTEVFSELSCQEEIEFQDFSDEMSAFIWDKADKWILQGTVGRWNGRVDGGFVFESFKELSRAWMDCDYIEFTDVDGHLYLTCSHHDGSNCYEIKRLTPKGYEFHAQNGDSQRVHSAIMNNNFYSGLPYYARDIYGVGRSKSA